MCQPPKVWGDSEVKPTRDKPEKLDLKNFLHDSLDLYCIRQLVLKSRHNILIAA